MSAVLSRIQTLVEAGEAIFSDHAYDRMFAADISTADILWGAAQATLIEDCPDFHKGPSLLALQPDREARPIHVVWGLRKGTTTPAVVITVYRPDPERWTSDFRSRT